MPWFHCANQRILDDAPCPTCGAVKPVHTVSNLGTRVFALGRTTPITLEAFDPQGLPLGGEPFSVTLPDGKVETGELDFFGQAEVRSKKKGVCKVRFLHYYAHDFEAPAPFGELAAAPVEEVEPPAPLPWIELQLVDATGAPVPFHPFAIQLPGAEAPTLGRLDEDGRARLIARNGGACKISFPGWYAHDFTSVESFAELDDDEPVEELEARAHTWLELEGLDAQGRPLAFQPFEVELPGAEEDGTKLVRLGALDEDGRARVWSPREGTCKVKFPGHYAHDFEAPAEFEELALEEPDADDDEPPARQAPAWIDLELRDDQGRPVPYHPFRIQVAGQDTPLEGTLDEDGRRRVRVPGGSTTCKVSFPGWYAHDFVEPSEPK